MIVRALVLSVALLPLGLLDVAQVAQAAVDEIEVRVSARRLDDGRTESVLQERRVGGAWGERRLPRARFFPSDASVERWLASSPLTVSLPGVTDIEVRVATQLLADGRMEFAIQGRREGELWTDRRLPRSRFFPADAVVDRWLASSPLVVSAPTNIVPFSFQDFINGPWLEQQHPQLASTIKRLGWVEDGIGETEAEAIQNLLYIVVTSRSVATSVVSLGWVQDGIEEIEAEAINWLRNIGSEEVAASVVSLGWVEDGIEAIEAEAIEQISYIDYKSPTVATSVVSLGWVVDGIAGLEVQLIEELSYLSTGHPVQAVNIASMQFLESVDSPDLAAIQALSALSAFRPEDFEIVISHPTIQDGITDDEAKIVVTLFGVSQYGHELLNTLLDPDKVSLEEKVLDLPLAGETLLAIIRIGPGAERSMDLLEHAVRHAEWFMAAPFPTGYVGWLVGDAVAPTFEGLNFGTHMVTLPKFDSDDDIESAGFAGALVAHEVAHYYWIGNSAWVDEGIADLMASVSESARTGRPVEVTNWPCGYVRAIVELESLDISIDDGADSAYGCNYSLGERLFVDLYRGLGEEVFRQGLRDLYLVSRAEDMDEAQNGMEIGIGDVRAAFGDDGGGDDATVDAIAARWFEGTEPYDNTVPDTDQPNPLLRTINGRIHLAYLAATQEGPPLSTISASAIGDGPWLLIRWTYTVGSDTEVPLELVHYYEDGFEFGRRSVSFTAKARHNDSLWWWWLPIGQSPDARWAPGEYRLHVYNEGRKLVELEYTVTR